MKIYFKNRNARFPEVRTEGYHIVLQWDDWNDYSYLTYFIAYLCTADEQIRIGPVRIMKLGQNKGERTFDKEFPGPIELDKLEPPVCSLGEDIKYYKKLSELTDRNLALEFLYSLNDSATDPTIRSIFQADDCFKISLLRESDSRIAIDDAPDLFGLTKQLINDFTIKATLPTAKAPHTFDFRFSEKRGLPHRIQAIVGLNGVGKTQIMARIAMLMSRFSRESIREKSSTLETEGGLNPVPSIHNVVAISFSAFDEFERPTEIQGTKFKYSYCGLRTTRGRLLNEDDLLANIKNLLEKEITEEKKEFLSEILGKLIKVDDIRDFIFKHQEYAGLYSRLSAGQRIALNALLHAIAKMTPRTLILFDEPELHLHPQLLTTMMSALSDILKKYDSFAIIATHSPIVVQQLPSHCVHIVLRERSTPIVTRPKRELFGENLSDITQHIFLTTESDRDYKDTLDRLLEENNFDADAVENIFGGRLGRSARIYLASRSDSIRGNGN
ncbi:MAG: ATP-binding protein [Azonexaceae bacterium]|nr:ATP-binding protein [Azonexaceae bacterium]